MTQRLSEYCKVGRECSCHGDQYLLTHIVHTVPYLVHFGLQKLKASEEQVKQLKKTATDRRVRWV